VADKWRRLSQIVRLGPLLLSFRGKFCAVSQSRVGASERCGCAECAVTSRIVLFDLSSNIIVLFDFSSNFIVFFDFSSSINVPLGFMCLRSPGWERRQGGGVWSVLSVRGVSKCCAMRMPSVIYIYMYNIYIYIYM